ncbi:hypothetical protein DVH24_001466 [Malus domestica]|uniref:Uncharacterized protein n=1 Tax=Malus domestica TaxID=3750 RepID=A0A498K7A8_MALDO|nr:hypothetical protein DVH24_001466 [Malus domestica]
MVSKYFGSCVKLNGHTQRAKLENSPHVKGRVESESHTDEMRILHVLISSYARLLPILPIGFFVEPQFSSHIILKN